MQAAEIARATEALVGPRHQRELGGGAGSRFTVVLVPLAPGTEGPAAYELLPPTANGA